MKEFNDYAMEKAYEWLAEVDEVLDEKAMQGLTTDERFEEVMILLTKIAAQDLWFAEGRHLPAPNAPTKGSFNQTIRLRKGGRDVE